MAGRRLGAGSSLGAQPISLLPARRQIQLSLPRLRHFAAGIAAVYLAALPQLVPAQDSEARKLEGPEL